MREVLTLSQFDQWLSMDPLEAVAFIVSLGMAAILLWAGLEKVRDMRSFASTIRALNIPHGAVEHLARLIVIAEIAVGLGLVFQPGMVWTQISVIVLALAFAAAGFLALRHDEPIRCNCFGSGPSDRLGVNQIIMLFPWIAGVSILHLGYSKQIAHDIGAVRLCAICLTLASWQSVMVWRAQREARGDRLSARMMNLWPH